MEKDTFMESLKTIEVKHNDISITVEYICFKEANFILISIPLLKLNLRAKEGDNYEHIVWRALYSFILFYGTQEKLNKHLETLKAK